MLSAATLQPPNAADLPRNPNTIGNMIVVLLRGDEKKYLQSDLHLDITEHAEPDGRIVIALKRIDEETQQPINDSIRTVTVHSNPNPAQATVTYWVGEDANVLQTVVLIDIFAVSQFIMRFLTGTPK